MKVLVENQQMMVRETVKQTDLLTVRNELLVKQIHYMRRGDEFNRMAFEASSGIKLEDVKNQENMNELHDQQAGERDAHGDLYHSDISLGGMDES